MEFERKEREPSEKNYYLLLLKWYWLIVPIIYFIFILPEKAMSTGTLIMTGEDIFTLLFQFINLILAGLIFMSNPLEQSKTGHADIFLKIAAAQQFLVQNWLGLILTVASWYKLPYKVKKYEITEDEKNKWFLESKTIVIVAAVSLVVSILSMIGNLS